MAKFSHKIIVRYEIAGGIKSNVTKFAHSELEARSYEDSIVTEIKNLGHTVLTTDLVQTKNNLK